MSFMAVMRNPSSGALFAIVNGSGEQVVNEWNTEAGARRAMKKHFYGKAWGWQIIEVESAVSEYTRSQSTSKGVENDETR